MLEIRPSVIYCINFVSERSEKSFLRISSFLQGDRDEVLIPLNGAGRGGSAPLFRGLPSTRAIKARYSLAPTADHEMINDETRGCSMSDE